MSHDVKRETNAWRGINTRQRFIKAVSSIITAPKQVEATENTMNGPTARFFAVCMAMGFTPDAMEVVLSMITAQTVNGFGRDRRRAAIEAVAPEFAAKLEDVDCDVLYVGSDTPLRDYAMVQLEYRWAQSEGPATPLWVTRLTGSMNPGRNNWRRDGEFASMPVWRAEVVAIARHYACDAVDREVAVIAPRSTREAIYEASQSTA